MQKNSIPFGHFLVVMDATNEKIVDRAKQILYMQYYLPAKMKLRHFAGLELGEPEFIINKSDDPFPDTVGWKAYADGKITNIAMRRIAMAAKRAEHSKRAFRRSLRKDWDDEE